LVDADKVLWRGRPQMVVARVYVADFQTEFRAIVAAGSLEEGVGSHEGETRLSMAPGSLWFQLHVKCDEAIEEG
jgi:hypothetical protein